MMMWWGPANVPETASATAINTQRRTNNKPSLPHPIHTIKPFFFIFYIFYIFTIPLRTILSNVTKQFVEPKELRDCAQFVVKGFGRTSTNVLEAPAAGASAGYKSPARAVVPRIRKQTFVTSTIRGAPRIRPDRNNCFAQSDFYNATSLCERLELSKRLQVVHDVDTARKRAERFILPAPYGVHGD